MARRLLVFSFSLERKRKICKKALACTRRQKHSSEFIERRLFARQYNGGCELFCDAFVAPAAGSAHAAAFQGLRAPIRNWVYWKTLIGRERK
jgi:hypothetical protein